MSEPKHLDGLEALRREHLEHIREFRLWLNSRSAGLYLIMDDETTVSYDLSGGHPGCMYQRALDTIVKVHMLWSGQKFEFHRESNCYLAWRRV